MPRAYNITPPVEVTAPTAYPITAEDVRVWSGLPDPVVDPVLQEQIIAASTAAVEREVGQQLLTATYRVKLSNFPCDSNPIRLPRPPLQSVTSIAYLDANGDSQTLASSVYRVTSDAFPGEISLAYGQWWPPVQYVDWPITLTYVCGRATVAAIPPDLLLCIRATADNFENYRGGFITGTIVAELPQSLKSILAAHRYIDFDFPCPVA